MKSAHAIDEICDEFESRLRSGARLTIEQILRSQSAEQRPQLLQSLLEIELEFLAENNAVPTRDDLDNRFPEDSQVVARAFDAFRNRFPDCNIDTKPYSASATTARITSVDIPAPDLPAKFGQYILQAALGRGGMGRVYRAHDTRLRRDVALKLPLMEKKNAEQLKRFRNEARVAATIDHPNICQILHIDEIDGQPYLTMKLVEGQSLSDWLHSGKSFPVQSAANLTRVIAEAMQVAHEKHVIHRDLKPANIMLNPDGTPTIVDFGLAYQDAFSGERLTQQGDMLGTPAYMPVEQARGEVTKIDQRSDIYSLGAILFRLLTGQPPYYGQPISIIGQIIAGETPNLHALKPELDDEIVAICNRAMASQQEDRYGSMAAFAEDLRLYLKRQQHSDHRGCVPAVSSRADTVGTQHASASSPRSSSSRSRSVAGKLLVGAGFFGLIVWLLSVIFVQTDYGTLHIEIGDPRIVVSIDGNEVGIQDGGKSLRLAVGDKRLQIRSDELEFEVEKTFTLKNADGEKRFHVVLLDNGQPELRGGPMPPPAQTSLKTDLASNEKLLEQWQALPHLSAVPPETLEPTFDGSQASIGARRKWYLNHHLSSDRGEISRRELFGLSEPSISLLDPQAIGNLLDRAAALWNREAGFTRTFKDASCSLLLGDEQVDNWKGDYFRARYSDAGQKLHVTRIPRSGEPPNNDASDILYAYDSQGNMILEVRCELDRKPIVDRTGYAFAVHAYENKTRRESRYFDHEGQLCEDEYGAHRRVYRNDGITLPFDRTGNAVDSWLPPLNLGKRFNAPMTVHPCFSADGTELFTQTFATQRDDRPVLRRSVWNGSRWSNPQELNGNETIWGLRPSISRDGSILAFVAWRTNPYPGNPEFHSYPHLPHGAGADVYVTERLSENHWGDVRNLDPRLNQRDAEAGVAFARESDELLIACRPEDGTQFEILRATLKDGSWSFDPRPIATGRNPCFAEHDSRIYFSQLREGKSRLCYVADWGTPQECQIAFPQSAESHYSDDGAAVSPDGSIVYFCRDKPWALLATGKRHSVVAIRHLAEIFAAAEWIEPGLPISATEVSPQSISVNASDSLSTTQSTIENSSQTANGDQESNLDPPLSGAPPITTTPLNVTEAKSHQRAWAKFLGVPIEFTNSVGMKFRLIPPGEFDMGGSDNEMADARSVAPPNDRHWQALIRSEAPIHRVRLTRPFYMSVHEVTQQQYSSVMTSNPAMYSSGGKASEYVPGVDTRCFPVENVSWHDAVLFCHKLSIADSSDGGLPDGIAYAYRLPTEAEWEYGCRAGTTSRYSSGDDLDGLKKVAWYGNPNPASTPHPVGQLAPNSFGLYDMHGNVWEWCQDWWSEDYYSSFTTSPAVNPTGPETGTFKVNRGGRWKNDFSHVRSANRDADSPTMRSGIVGFRVCLDLTKSLQEALHRDGTRASDQTTHH